MRKIFALLLCLIAVTAPAQVCPTGPAQLLNAYYEYKWTKFRELLQIPRHAPGSSCRDTAMTYYNPTDSALHWWTGHTDQTFLQHANQGAYDSSHTVQLGEPLNQSGSPSRLYQIREVPLNAFGLRLWDSLNSSSYGYTQFGDTMHTTASGAVQLQETHQADTINNGFNWLSFRPKNYGTVYAGARPNGGDYKAMDWTFGYSQNSSGGLPMPDNVFGMGYNMLNGVSRKDTGDGAVSFRLETSFSVLGPGGAFEAHWPELIRDDGTLQRVNSWYMAKHTGNTLWESNLGDHVYKRVAGTNPGGNWLNLTDNSGDFGSISMFGTHAHSIGGVFNFIDSSGVYFQLRSLDGTLDFIPSGGSSLAAQILNNGQIFLNTSTFPAASAPQNTICGQYDDGSQPANVNSAQMAVTSQHKGFLPPSMTTVQKLAISSPAEGLMVYDLTLHQMSYYNGTTWVNF